MGAAPSKPVPSSSSTESTTEYDEKLSGRLAQLSLASAGAPLSADGGLKLAHVDKWEAADASDPRIQLSRTVLAQTNIREALISRSAKIADPQVYNTEIDFKTSPITNQKCVSLLIWTI
jgi:bleomycin hydrolase